MGAITQIVLSIDTKEDLSENHRLFFGFEADSNANRPQGREFRCRRAGSNDANPFRNGVRSIAFGNGSDVANPNDNDPRNPQLDSDLVGRAYIRIDPNSSEPWRINNASITYEVGGVRRGLNLSLAPITLDEDAGEKAYFTPLT